MISVLMRSHNDIAFIRQTLEALLSQEVDEIVEIISCDDHSTDGTAEYLQSIPGLRRIAPPDGRYIPGKTLNLMVREARGEYIIFNNGDAIPQNQDYLKNLVAPLKNKSVDCVFANQIARDGMIDPAKTCVACGSCEALISNGKPTGCVVRDGNVYLKYYKEI